MATETRSICPQLRPDLVIEKQGQGKTVRYIISDPVSGRYFSCGGPQQALLMLFTGQLTTSEITTRYSTQTRILLRPEQLTAVLHQLEGLGFLLHTGTADPSTTLAPTRLRKSRWRVKYRWKLFPMQRLLPPIQPYTSWLFSPAFLGVFVLLTLTTGWILLHGGWEQGTASLLFDLSVHPSLSSWGIFLAALFITCYLHECGHVIALQHFGRQPGYLGVGFAWPLGPIVYVEIGEIWRLAQARQRILVNLAGPVASLLVGGIGAIGWWLLPADLPWSLWLISFMAVGAMTGVYNLIPFRGTDGYFALTDAVHTPNLDRKARVYLMETLLRPLRRRRPAQKLARGQRVLFAGYGVITLLLNAWLLWVFGGLLLRSVVSLVHSVLSHI